MGSTKVLIEPFSVSIYAEEDNFSAGAILYGGNIYDSYMIQNNSRFFDLMGSSVGEKIWRSFLILRWCLKVKRVII